MACMRKPFNSPASRCILTVSVTELKLGAAAAINIDSTDTVTNSSNKVNPRVISQIPM
ncbi:hypothetical protein VCR12J2_980075 [Vibrio coralliirubri]|nr:hypothetical protein VCR12J2_980075 [Vibrio coralliirubri]